MCRHKVKPVSAKLKRLVSTVACAENDILIGNNGLFTVKSDERLLASVNRAFHCA